MKKLDRANFIMKKLNEIYPTTPIPLNHKNNFELLIAVLLSAQCTDERVNIVTPELFSLANSYKAKAYLLVAVSEKLLFELKYISF